MVGFDNVTTHYVYDQASFFELKLNWFLQLHYRGNTLAIFGAGTKGKTARDFLIKREVEFNIYDIQHEKLQNVRPPSTATEDIALTCVYPENKNELEKFLDSKNYVIGENAWYL